MTQPHLTPLHVTKSPQTEKPDKPYPEFPCSLRRGDGQRRLEANLSISAHGMTQTAPCSVILTKRTTYMPGERREQQVVN